MKTLSKNKTDNLGGILNLYLVPSDNIFTDTENLETGIHEISFLDENLNWKLECSAESIEFQEKENTDMGSSIYNSELSAFIPGDTPEISFNLNKLINGRPWIIIFEDQNGNYRMAGAEDCPFRLTRTLNTESKISDLKGYKLSAKADTFNKAVFINNPFD